jgi:hypothetical protein
VGLVVATGLHHVGAVEAGCLGGAHELLAEVAIEQLPHLVRLQVVEVVATNLVATGIWGLLRQDFFDVLAGDPLVQVHRLLDLQVQGHHVLALALAQVLLGEVHIGRREDAVTLRGDVAEGGAVDCRQADLEFGDVGVRCVVDHHRLDALGLLRGHDFLAGLRIDGDRHLAVTEPGLELRRLGDARAGPGDV